MSENSLSKKDAIKSLVYTAVESYAEGFQARHEAEKDDPEGTLNMKIHNVLFVLEQLAESFSCESIRKNKP